MGYPSQDITDSKFTDFGEYVKTVPIQARQMEVPFTVRTLEGLEEGKPGDWLAVGPAGERYIIRDEIFRKTYALAPVKMMEEKTNRKGENSESGDDAAHPLWKGNCPYTSCPTECRPPIFATGFHICGTDQSAVICFNFRHKLLLTVVVDRALEKDLMEEIKIDFQRKEVRSNE